MSSPDDNIVIPFSKGGDNEPLIIPSNIPFSPLDDTERLASEDPTAQIMPKAQWDAILSQLKGREITVGNISQFTNLPLEDAQAIYTALEARGRLVLDSQKTFFRRRELGRIVLRDETHIDPENPPKSWGLVIGDYSLNGRDFGESYAQVFLPRKNPKAVRWADRQNQDNQTGNHSHDNAKRTQRDERSQGPKSSDEQPFFDTMRLLELHTRIGQAIRDEAHHRKDERGVAKLPDEEFQEIAAEVREKLTRQYLGGGASDDLMHRVDLARGSAVATLRRSRGKQQ